MEHIYTTDSQEWPYLSNTVADVRLMGSPYIFAPFSHMVTAPRTAMFSHNLAQWMVLNNPETPLLFTGMEHKLADYTFNRSKRVGDFKVLELLPKYQANVISGGGKNCPRIIAVGLVDCPDGVTRLDYFEINKYEMGANGFGYLNKISNRDLIRPGETIDKEALLTHSPAVTEDGEYAMGVNLNVMFGSFPSTIEDAFTISESARDKLCATCVGEITINLNQDNYLLNTYGDAVTELCLPPIGSRVRADGVLLASRPAHWTTWHADSDPESIRTPQDLQDDIVTAPAGATIVDYTIRVNLAKHRDLHPQLAELVASNNKYHQMLYSIYLSHRKKYPLTDKMSSLVTESLYHMLAQGTRMTALGNMSVNPKNADVVGAGGAIVDYVQIVVHYTLPRQAIDGSKLTDLYGGKGVIGQILPDELMPRDEHGNVAEVLVDLRSSVARNNPGALYEPAVNFVAEFARRKILRVAEEEGTDPAFEMLLDFFNDINPNYAKLAKETLTHPLDRSTIVSELKTNPIRLNILPASAKFTGCDDEPFRPVKLVLDLMDKWGAVMTPVTFGIPQGDGTVKHFTTREPCLIGKKYYLHLNKLPDMAASGPAAVNHFGYPTKNSFGARSYSLSYNPYKYGEDEVRVMCAGVDVREIVRLLNLSANSVRGVSTMVRSLLTADKPMAINRFPISNGTLAATNEITNLFHSVSMTFGVDMRNTLVTEDDVGISNYLTDAIHSAVLLEENGVGRDREGPDDGDEYCTDGIDDVAEEKLQRKYQKTAAFMAKLLAQGDLEEDDGDDIDNEGDDVDVESAVESGMNLRLLEEAE